MSTGGRRRPGQRLLRCHPEDHRWRSDLDQRVEGRQCRCLPKWNPLPDRRGAPPFTSPRPRLPHPRPRPHLPSPALALASITRPRPRLPHPRSPLHARVQHCVAVLEGNRAKIVVTRDGGKTWNTTMVEEDIHAALIDVHMIDEKEGWAAGGCKRERGLEPCPLCTPATRS
jgi:hypothetical protein